MKPIKFEQANKNLLKPESMTDEECSSLWVYNDGRECISCWRLTWKERIKALLFGRVWLSVLSGRTQPPVWLASWRMKTGMLVAFMLENVKLSEKD